MAGQGRGASSAAVMMPSFDKPAVEGRSGIVYSQCPRAAALGSAILEDGGTAFDAVGAMALALTATEPWASGIGGGGIAVLYEARTKEAFYLDFVPRTPRKLDLEDFVLEGGSARDLFGWPKVRGEINLRGYRSVLVPTVVAAVDLMLRRFSSNGFGSAARLAADEVAQGLAVDWYVALKIATARQSLADDPIARGCFLAGDEIQMPGFDGPAPLVHFSQAEALLRQLADEGASDFYSGDVADALCADVAEGGGYLDLQDLRNYEPLLTRSSTARMGDATIFLCGANTGAPVVQALADRAAATATEYGLAELAASGAALFRDRIGETEATTPLTAAEPTHTSHLACIDRWGNAVGWTQTIVSTFGAAVMGLRTGFLLNNGTFWFDPRPGRPNSLGPDKPALSNACPVISRAANGSLLVVGGSGGRRIIPAVFQIAAGVACAGRTVSEAVRAPRVDFANPDDIVVDTRLPGVAAHLADKNVPHRTASPTLYPSLFATVGAIARAQEGFSGQADLYSPWATCHAPRDRSC